MPRGVCVKCRWGKTAGAGGRWARPEGNSLLGFRAGGESGGLLTGCEQRGREGAGEWVRELATR